MKHFFLLIAVVLLGTVEAQAQDEGPLPAARVAELVETSGILRNGISNLHAEGDTLWVSPLLNLTPDGGRTWLLAEADSLQDARSRVFSIDVEGEVVWVGLGFTSEGQPSAGGFLFSEDGGRTFTYRLPPLDAPDDSLVVYGASTLGALPVIVPQQSPPFDIDYDPFRGTVYTAGWASGLRRSDDQGRTWQRVVLPPDGLSFITPDSTYDFRVAPQRGGGGGNFNHMGFSVLVDETATVWAGTPWGVNRSTDGGVSWQRFRADGTPGTLGANWVVSIEEQPLPGRNPVWFANWNAGEAGESFRDGVSVTRDGGATFEQALVGETVIDFAFRGETVYAAGRSSGLLVSEDGGRTWEAVRDFRVAGDPARTVRLGVDVLSVATTPEALWVGTDDGLLKTTAATVDARTTWQAFRAEVPLHPETPSEAVPDVDTYAYPNPFSAPIDGVVRIRYAVDGSRTSEIRIFDFGLNLVRSFHHACSPVGGQGARDECEATWDGTDEGGFRVANGVYFYTVDAGGAEARGKILVVE